MPKLFDLRGGFYHYLSWNSDSPLILNLINKNHMNKDIKISEEILKKRRWLTKEELKIEIGKSYLCCLDNRVFDIAFVNKTDDGLVLNGISWDEGEGLKEFDINQWEFFLDATEITKSDIRNVVAPYNNYIKSLEDERNLDKAIIKELEERLAKFEALADEAKAALNPKTGMLTGPSATFNSMQSIIERMGWLSNKKIFSNEDETVIAQNRKSLE